MTPRNENSFASHHTRCGQSSLRDNPAADPRQCRASLPLSGQPIHSYLNPTNDLRPPGMLSSRRSTPCRLPKPTCPTPGSDTRTSNVSHPNAWLRLATGDNLLRSWALGPPERNRSRSAHRSSEIRAWNPRNWCANPLRFQLTPVRTQDRSGLATAISRRPQDPTVPQSMDSRAPRRFVSALRVPGPGGSAVTGGRCDRGTVRLSLLRVPGPGGSAPVPRGTVSTGSQLAHTAQIRSVAHQPQD